MLHIRRAIHPELREQIYALRYRVYRRENALDEIPSAMFMDRYDTQPNHVLWAATKNDRVVGSIRTMWLDTGQGYSGGREFPCGTEETGGPCSFRSCGRGRTVRLSGPTPSHFVTQGHLVPRLEARRSIVLHKYFDLQSLQNLDRILGKLATGRTQPSRYRVNGHRGLWA